MSMDIVLPEVRAHTQTARFFKSGTKDKVEISFVGSKDTIIQTVNPGHMAAFKAEWDAYCDGSPLQQRKGTPLTDLPSISEERAKDYIHRNVHTLEELAALNDGQCQMLGHGTLTDRKGAIQLVTQRQFKSRDEQQRKVQEATAALGPKPAERFAANSDIEAVKAEVAELKQGMGQILELLQKRKGGRPKKAQAE